VPVPEFGSLAELNDQLAAFCIADLRRTIDGRQETVGELLSRELEHLRALPEEAFPTWEESTNRVNQKSMVTVRRNHYSVPVRLAGLKVLVRVGAREIWVLHDGREVARHPRLRGTQQRSARLDHYLELLQRKPGALEHSLALRQEREQGRWPECIDDLWQAIEAKVGASEAARQIVDVLLLCREHGLEAVELAVRGVLAAGAYDGRAVQVLVERKARPAPEAPLSGLDERLQELQRPAPTLSDYNELIVGEAGQ
jgi:Mu transposase, C-terminal domain